MLLLQFGIGAANDWADAAPDATARPAKPIPAGLIRRPVAARIAAGAAMGGLALAALAGLPALAVAAVGLATGLVYDLRLKRTRWSWLPYAVGIPLLPVFAWIGATGSLPASFAVLVPIAMVAGAALAVANAVADVEGDQARGDRDGRNEPRARPGPPAGRRAPGPGHPCCPLVGRAPRR